MNCLYPMLTLFNPLLLSVCLFFYALILFFPPPIAFQSWKIMFFQVSHNADAIPAEMEIHFISFPLCYSCRLSDLLLTLEACVQGNVSLELSSFLIRAVQTIRGKICTLWASPSHLCSSRHLPLNSPVTAIIKAYFCFTRTWQCWKLKQYSYIHDFT